MIVKEKLAYLPMCYCITLMEYNGREYCVSASEERDGEVVMIDTQTKAVSKITGLSGGVMAVVPVPEENGAFFVIQKFYPVFDSKKAEIAFCRISGAIAEQMHAEVKTVVQLPYVHRIALVGTADRRKLIAAALCKDKASVDDWSKPGAVYEYTLGEDMTVTAEKTLLEGISKNHGMYTYEKKGGSYLLVSGEQGVWAIDGSGNTRKFCDEPVSDLCLFDVDGDGMDEMVCIAPFHGDTMKVYKMKGEGWSCIAEEGIAFGHAVWSGLCGGEPLLLSSSRSGDKCTRIYHPCEGEQGFELEKMDIDEGVGASNIFVKETKETVILYAANHEAGEIARYFIEL